MSERELAEAIELKRKEMMDSANTLGFTHERTISYSRELDVLIVMHVGRPKNVV